MKFSNVKAIAWDLDGTILDSLGVFERVLSDVLIEQDKPMFSKKTLLNNFHGSLEDTLENVLGLKTHEELAVVLEIFVEKQMKYYVENVDALLFADAVELVKQAARKDILQLIVTNRGHKDRGPASPRAIVASTVLSDYIHEIRSGDEVEYKKPDARSIQDWLDKHEIHPDQLIVIGDQVVDVQLAQNLSARAILLARVDRVGDQSLYSDQKNKKNVYILNSLDNIGLN